MFPGQSFSCSIPPVPQTIYHSVLLQRGYKCRYHSGYEQLGFLVLMVRGAIYSISGTIVPSSAEGTSSDRAAEPRKMFQMRHLRMMVARLAPMNTCLPPEKT